MILRAADAVFDRQILHRLHVQRDAVDFLEFRLQPADHVGGVDVPLFQRLQIDENAPAIERGIGSVDADEGGKTLDGGIFQNDLWPAAAAAAAIAGNEMDCGASEIPWMMPVSCTGKKPFGTMM